MTRWRLLVLALGCLLRLYGVERPIDYRSVSLWHEADNTEIMRNFVREGMNPAYPRIDWRGDTSGLVEMEAPILPWTAALAAQLFGSDERVMRLLAVGLSIGALLLFDGLARRVLDGGAALFAIAAFAINPLALYLAPMMQPEAPMVFLALLAASLIWRWLDQPSTARLFAAAAALGAAILAKQPAAALGLLFAWCILRRYGLAAWREWRVYLAAGVALAPAVAWYGWAYHFWLSTGNSLGLSDEAHVIGLDVLVSRGLLGNARAEILDVFSPVGIVLAAIGLRLAWRRLQPAVVWYAAVAVFSFVAARTMGSPWAFYYHCQSIAPACLLMGAGVQTLAAFPRPRPTPAGRRLGRSAAAWLGGATIAALIATSVWRVGQRDGVFDAASSGVEAQRRRELCAHRFASAIPADGRIAIKGLQSRYDDGHMIAINQPDFFVFADRKGFVYAGEEQSIATLEALAARGAGYWIVDAADLLTGGPDAGAAGLDRAEVDRRYRRLDACDEGYALYALRPAAP